MKRMLPIIGTAAVFVQIIRFWPITFTTLLSALVTGAIFYFACKFGWDTQRGQIFRKGYTDWGNWLKRALLGTSLFLALSLTLLFFSFNNPICEETGDPFFGRCEKYTEESAKPDNYISFNLAGKSLYPLFLAMAFLAGSAATRIEYTRKTGNHNDRRKSPREY